METEEVNPGRLKGADEQMGSGRVRHDALDIVTSLPPPVATCSPQPPERNPESPKAAPSPTTASQERRSVVYGGSQVIEDGNIRRLKSSASVDSMMCQCRLS